MGDVVYILFDSGSDTAEGVFSTWEDAKLVAARLDINTVIGFSVDHGLAEIKEGLLPYWVELDLVDHTESQARRSTLDHFKQRMWLESPDVAYVDVWARDPDEAIVKAQRLYKEETANKKNND